MTSPELFVFQHIPKTAGTTWRAIAYQQFPDNAVCPIYDDGYFCTRREFAALPDERKRRFAMLIGHFGQDIHALLPAGLQARFGVFLRRPLERCLSHINHLANRQRKGEALSVDGLIAERLQPLDNLQVRSLSTQRAAFGEVSASMLEEALERLHGYAFVGLCHRFAESYALAAAQLGWNPVPFATRNTSEEREVDFVAQVSPAERARLAELNRFDELLVQRFEATFAERLRECETLSRWPAILDLVRRCAAAASRLPYESEGAIGYLAADAVRGWARLRQCDEPAHVEVLVGSRVLGRVAARDPRGTLRDKGVMPGGRCGFEVTFREPLGHFDPRAVRVVVAQSRQELRLNSP